MSVLTVFRTHPLIHVSYLIALVPGVVLLANGAVPTTLARRLRRVRRLRALQHQPRLRTARAGLRQPELPPHPPPAGGPQDVNLGFALTIWDQLVHRAVFPTARDDPRGHRTAGATAGRRAGRSRPRHLPVLLAQLFGPFRPLDPRTPVRRQGGRRPASTRNGGITAADHGRSWRPVRAVARPCSDGPSAPAPIGRPGRRDRARLDLPLLRGRKALRRLRRPGSTGRPCSWRTAPTFAPGVFAVLGGVIEFGGVLALALGLGTRLAGLALLGDQVMAMITVSGRRASTPCRDPRATNSTWPWRPWPSSSRLGAGRLSLDSVIARHLASTATPRSARRTAPRPGATPPAGSHLPTGAW